MQGKARVNCASGFDQADLIFGHTGKSHALSCTFLQTVEPATHIAGGDAFGG
jgi:hypothetical protein